MIDDIPTVVSSGTVRVGDLEITVHHLSNGQRVIEAADFERAMKWLGLNRGAAKARSGRGGHVSGRR